MRLALALLVAAALLASAAEPVAAHRYANPRYSAAEALEARISAWRTSRGMNALYPSVSTLLASIAIQQANYQEARYGKQIAAAPFAAWSAQFFGTQLRGIVLTNRCHGARYRARTAFRALLDNPKSRAILAWPTWYALSVRAVYTHQHRGYYIGKGRCAPYYLLFAASLAR